MLEVKREFTERMRELVEYVRFTEAVCNEEVRYSANEEAMSLEVSRTMKASCFLLIYNLIESTARNAVQAIFDQIESEGVSFDQVIDELRLFVLKQTKKRKPEKLMDRITYIANDIFKESIDSREFFSGNVDSRELRKTAKKLGVGDAVKRDGSKLLTIKTHRNDLAHGWKTFLEIGKDTSASDLVKYTSAAFWYMREVLEHYYAFIDQKKYLRRVAV